MLLFREASLTICAPSSQLVVVTVRHLLACNLSEQQVGPLSWEHAYDSQVVMSTSSLAACLESSAP
jgi:hypothetical protein